MRRILSSNICPVWNVFSWEANKSWGYLLSDGRLSLISCADSSYFMNYNFEVPSWLNQTQVVKSDNFRAMASLIDRIGELPGTPPKNKKKHFLFVTPTIEHGLLRNKSFNFNVHMISPSGEGAFSNLFLTYGPVSIDVFPAGMASHQITSLCPALGYRYALILPGMCDPSLQDPMGKILPGMPFSI